MRAAEQWRPSKYVLRRGRLRASRDPAQVNPASRLTADLAAAAYQRLLQQHATGHLLDFGCGTAPLYGVYGPQVDDVTCVDWQPADHVDEVLDLGRGAPTLPDASFDTIVATDVLEHLPEPHLVWEDFARLLKPGGALVVGVPFFYWLHEPPHDYYRYTEFALRRHAEQAGFDVHHLAPFGGPLEIVADIVAKAASPLPALAAAVCALGALLRRIGPLRRLSATASDKMPLGYAGVFVRR